jgi:hypothetical protein
LASDQGRKAEAISRFSLLCGGWLGPLPASEKSGVRVQLNPILGRPDQPRCG